MKEPTFEDVQNACMQAKAVIAEFELSTGLKVTGYDLDPDAILAPGSNPEYQIETNGAIRSREREHVIHLARQGKYGTFAEEWAKTAPTLCFITLPAGLLSAEQQWQVGNNTAYAQWRLGHSGYESWFTEFHRRATPYWAYEFGEHPWIPVQRMDSKVFLSYGQATPAMEGPKIEELGLYAAFELWGQARSARRALNTAFYEDFPFLAELSHLLRS